jgi:pimeloyl-ACP methyl ester carboxylesterase
MSVSQHILSIEGRPAKYWTGGSGQPVVLLHGELGDARQQWAPTLEALSLHFQIIAPELPGFGVSAPLPMPSYQSFLNWLLLLLDMLNVGGPLLLLGNSFGATLARFFAAENTEYVARLVLVDGGQVISAPGWMRPFLRLPGFNDVTVRALRRRTYSHDHLQHTVIDTQQLTPEFVAKVEAAAPGFAAALRQSALIPPPLLRTPTCATLIIWGALDRLSTVETGRAIAAEISGARFVLIPKAAHLPQIEQPDEFHRVVEPFLKNS